MLQSLRRCAALAVGALTLASAAHAAPYSNLYIFGDSLSDTGNVRAATTAFGFTPFPSYPGAEGRFSNGPVWVEHLAAGLGLPNDDGAAKRLLTGAGVISTGVPEGNNYAYGGARTGLGGSAGPTTGLLGQLIAWNGSAFASSLTRAADPNALYVIAAGGNDMRDFRSGVTGATSPVQAATNVVNAIGLLAQAGARNFLIGNLPSLAGTPEAVSLGLAAPSLAATLAYNAALSAGLAGLDAQFLALTGVDLDIDLVDLYGLTAAVVADATTNGGAVYGITNITTPCITPVLPGVYFAPGSTAVNCGSSLFSDDLHPSAAAHRILGNAALAALGVPEPGTLILVASSLGLLVLRRRSRAAV